MILLDTHAWIWFVSDPDRLSKRARGAIEDGVDKKRVLISSISAWEVALLVEKDRLALVMPARDWITKSESLPFFDFIPVDNHIAVKSVTLPPTLHDDPADRIIIATAIIEGATIVTKDKRIQTYPHVKSTW